MKILKAGKYYLGDCCYVLDHKVYDWNDFCHKFWANGENITIDNKEIVAYDTLYGDGVYASNIGIPFPVDAGLIGIVPAEMWKNDAEPFGCFLIEFKQDFECKNLGNGTLQFGHVIIETGDAPDEDNQGGDDR